MKYFKDAIGTVYAYEADGSQDAFIAPNLEAITEEDADAIRFTAPTVPQLIARYEGELDAHLDRVAAQYCYRDRITFALRSGFPGPYQAEGKAFGTWMDTCNAQAYLLLTDVLAGKTELPTVADFIASLPAFVKP